jgi:putative phage-type endonuclease
MPPYTVETYHDRESWLASRRNGIGASEIAAICGESSYASPYSVWAEKRGLLPAKEETQRMRMGRRNEGAIADEYAFMTGHIVSGEEPFMIHRSADNPWMFCSLDREILAEETNPPLSVPGLLECKNFGALRDNEEAIDGIPPSVYLQVQWQFAVTGFLWGVVAILVGGAKLHIFEVAPHAPTIAALIATGRDFWQRVLGNDPPPVDGSEATEDALESVYPRTAHAKPTTVVLPLDAVAWDEERTRIVREMKALETRKRELDNCLRDAIGLADVGIGPGFRYELNTVHRKSYTVAESQSVRLTRKGERHGE